MSPCFKNYRPMIERFIPYIIIVIVILVDSQINTAPPPQIVYVENYGPERSDEDIIRDQKKASRSHDDCFSGQSQKNSSLPSRSLITSVGFPHSRRSVGMPSCAMCWCIGWIWSSSRPMKTRP